MHERSLAGALLTQVAEVAKSHGGVRVATIRISVGQFAGVEPDLFQSALEELLVESPFCGASVEMKVVDIEALCPECRQPFAVKSFSFTCPACGCQRTQVIRGEGLILESVVLKEMTPCPTPN
ncbi:hydrogenase maturation nickel metallochaperone HypA [Blastopirellula sp. JC732]|uniref:Hydrogenase maturation factor HypA n=1 Tax=Blastopirellula sediminis TaxID=2894196 RepID=A0A9X1MMC5_9BACT|nr:hydrogenase maturation nickel metallochaperone HypA [Blastopirellula sediminis]MCC9608348.1 hydrogenase maturation nickel metallochaperone HypA [Blastopirellula sediminis]MCC9628875.1 hydrogenase maturation nickel metallochaperone HypA [Blastopirellula sediminis]